MIKYTWKQFDKDCERLARLLQGQKFSAIYGIPRGGLVVAVGLSHLLNLPLIIDYKKVSKNTLVVDDICDTGKTINKLKRVIKKPACFATLFYTKETKGIAKFSCRIKKDWIIFPWETQKTSKYDNTF